MNKRSDNFFSGTSGLVIPGPRAQYPPIYRDKSRLEYYASLFNSLEVNSSFYKTPKAATVAKWAALVPVYFQFTFKLSKAITHVKGLAFNEDDVEAFMKTIEAAGDKKGCLLIQFPPSHKIELLDKLQSLLSAVSFYNEAGWKLAIELRHASWYKREVYEILNEHGACLVIHDIPASAAPIISSQQDFTYLRFHGPGGRYRGGYSDELLSRYANFICEEMNAGKTVYFYFNNTMGDAVKDLQTLNGMISRQHQ